MRKLHVYLAAALAAVMVLTPAEALAADAIPKEEVVYAALTPDGALDTVDVVNIFDLAEAGEITDHGDYESVRAMNTTDPIDYADGAAVIDAGPGRLYYEGRMADPALPWRISLTYELDGEEIDPAALAGQSGELAIRLTVDKDQDCPGTFFEDYALQAVVTLDTARCTDIDAPGATAANVGADKQLTYTVLPGAGADITVTADVTDFEMDGVAINGVLMSLGGMAGLDDAAAELEAGLDELAGSSAQLTEGSAALLDGLRQLQTALSGVTFTQEDADALTAGVASLQDAAGALSAQLETVTAAAEGLAALQAGYVTAADGLRAAVDAMNAASLPSTEPLEAVWQGLDTCNGQFAGALEGMAGLSDAAAQLQSGMEELAASLEALSGQMTGLTGALPQLTASVDALVEADETLDAGVQAYTQGVDETVRGKLDEVMSSVGGGDVDVTSFASPDNENVTSVQFVITAPAIQIPTPETPEPTPAPSRTFWQKLTDLF